MKKQTIPLMDILNDNGFLIKEEDIRNHVDKFLNAGIKIKDEPDAFKDIKTIMAISEGFEIGFRMCAKYAQKIITDKFPETYYASSDLMNVHPVYVNEKAKEMH